LTFPRGFGRRKSDFEVMSNGEGAVCFDVVKPPVVLVTIDRPQVRNAKNVATAERIEQLVRKVEAEPDIWTVWLGR
jgi:enoyl-CoA hydratase/carnithine racemase